MANFVFPAALTGLMTGLIDLDTAAIKAAYVRGYTPDTADVFVSEVVAGGGTLNGTSDALTGKTVVAGVLDADDTDVPTTADATDHSILLFQASAVTGGADVAQNAQRVIAYFDTGTNLPIQPGTGDTPITWDNGANKIIKLG